MEISQALRQCRVGGRILCLNVMGGMRFGVRTDGRMFMVALEEGGPDSGKDKVAYGERDGR